MPVELGRDGQLLFVGKGHLTHILKMGNSVEKPELSAARAETKPTTLVQKFFFRPIPSAQLFAVSN